MRTNDCVLQTAETNLIYYSCRKEKKAVFLWTCFKERMKL